jgi:hypothetical protein
MYGREGKHRTGVMNQLQHDHTGFQPERIVVYHGDESEGLRQPGTTAFCQHGVQLYNRRSVAECELVEVTLELPPLEGEPERFTCIGLVAHCQFDPALDLFKVAVKFLDLPASAQQRIAALTPPSQGLCPFFESSLPTQ